MEKAIADAPVRVQTEDAPVRVQTKTERNRRPAVTDSFAVF